MEKKKEKFDSIFAEKKSGKIWIPYSKNNENYKTSSTLLAKDTFYKKGRRFGMWKARLYLINKNVLFYKKNENSFKILKIMNFDSIHFSVVQIPKSEKYIYGFEFFKNGQISQIFTNEEAVFLRWKHILSLKLLQHDFQADFEIKKVIGKGSFAKVFLAMKKETNELFAVKTLNKEYLLSQPNGKEGLLNEIEIMRKLDHKNIIKIYEVYETKGSIYLVLEILKGGELLKSIKQRKTLFNDIERAKIMKNFLQALNHIHENGIMHRDLKPENILLKDEISLSDIVIADFGLACFIDMNSKDILFKRCGTPGYVAPEIFNYSEKDQFYNEKCDIFSAGVIFYILISGKKPFQGKDLKEVLKANKSGIVDFSLCSHASLEARNLLKNMLEILPENRISAKKALEHAYFKILQDNQKVDFFEESKNVEEFLSDLKTSKNSKSPDEETSLVLREPILTGNIKTFDKFSMKDLSVVSLVLQETKALDPKRTSVSKFGSNTSQNHRKGPSKNSHNLSSIITNRNTNLQKQAIFNNSLKKN